MRIGSLFSGYGGLDIAVQNVYGGHVVWYSEIDKHACTVLADRHPDVPNLGDITTVDWADVPPVDILTGGYPCQPFSHAGKREGTNDERHLWPYVRDAIVALRPMVTVLENVDGHRSLGLDVVLGDLAEVGLSARWGVVRAADAGAPHGRKRVFIVVTQPDQPGRQGTDAGLDVAAGWQGAGGHAAQGDHVATADPDGERYGSGQGSAQVGRMGGAPESSGRQASTSRKVSGAGSDQATADTDPIRLPITEHQPGSAGWHCDASERTLLASGDPGQRGDTDWGKYGPAIRRWESVSGRPAPAPTVPGTNGRPRLSPVFVEWMMGLEAGHVTGHGLKPAACLKMLGNGVVPQQAELALRMLLDGGVANEV